MREILFRGKRLDNGEWVEGYLGQDTIIGNGKTWLGYVIKPIPQKLWDCGWFEIDPATVSQHIGMTDKNGERIFEGDIVHILGDQTSDNWKSVDYTALIAFIDSGFCAIDGTIEEHGFRRYALACMDFSLEVIGNIHDNPELLKDGDTNG